MWSYKVEHQLTDIGHAYTGNNEHAGHMGSQDTTSPSNTPATQSVDVLRSVHAGLARKGMDDSVDLDRRLLVAKAMQEIEALIRKWEGTGV